MNLRKQIVLIVLLCCAYNFYAQNSTVLNVTLDTENKSLLIQQEITYTNLSDDTLSSIYLNDWNNSFSSKISPLGKRFSEDYLRRFYFAKDSERGFTKVNSIVSNTQTLEWSRPQGKPDIIELDITTPLRPNESIVLKLNYVVRVPDEKFTRYGYYDNGDFKLRYWYITPTVYDGTWQNYSHKNLDDQFFVKSDVKIMLQLPAEYSVTSSLKASEAIDGDIKNVTLEGTNIVDNKLYLTKSNNFDTIETDYTTIETNVDDDGLELPAKALAIDRILSFLENKLGEYPQDKILVTDEDYRANPVYGLNQLPDFLRPFPDGFQYEIKQLKTITDQYLSNTLLLNPRKEKWLHDAIHIKLMMDYVDRYYPKMKILGSLSNIIGIRWFHAADLEFNDQYPYLYMNMARMNLDQPLEMPTDSLVKFNENIANPYKAGTGFKYLEDYLETDDVDLTIKEFYQKYKLEQVSTNEFRNLLTKNAPSEKDVNWFFEDYLSTNKKIDFKIKRVKKGEDSLTVTIENKRGTVVPVPIYGIKKGKTLSKTWVDPFKKKTTITIPRDSSSRVGLNYEGIVPEFNQRDNYKRVTSLLNKPLQFRFIQDIEDPRYSQTFFIPEVEYNVYDGVALGIKLFNKAVLSRNFVYKISPKYGFKSKAIVGSASIYNTTYYDNESLNAIRYGFSGNRFSFAPDLFYNRYTPFVNFFFRNPYLRSNEKQSLTFRYISVQRDFDVLNPLDEPNYDVFNARYNYSNPNLTNLFSGYLDFQLADNFGKVSANLTYRKLFLNNRQLNLRFFAGTFLYNDTRNNSDYFSFALDRPTDYLFDYNYYGRSEEDGLFSQQIIPAEGFFKSQLEPAFANQWLTTLNGGTNIWKWIFAYGDVGFVKNKGFKPKFVYDTGVRASLVQDYFELFFPVYSNNGWEIAQDNYDEKIRFIVTLDIQTIIRLFTREWY